MWSNRPKAWGLFRLLFHRANNPVRTCERVFCVSVAVCWKLNEGNKDFIVMPCAKASGKFYFIARWCFRIRSLVSSKIKIALQKLLDDKINQNSFSSFPCHKPTSTSISTRWCDPSNFVVRRTWRDFIFYYFFTLINNRTHWNAWECRSTYSAKIQVIKRRARKLPEKSCFPCRHLIFFPLQKKSS